MSLLLLIKESARSDVIRIKSIYYNILLAYENYQYYKLRDIREQMKKIKFTDRKEFILNKTNEKKVFVWSILFEK